MNKTQTIKEKENEKADDTQYEEIEDANFYRFENIGDKIEGMVVEIGHSKRYAFGLYTIMNKDGEKIRFHGTTHLDTLMSNIEEQDYIKIEYIDTQETPAGDMKLFKVFKKK